MEEILEEQKYLFEQWGLKRNPFHPDNSSENIFHSSEIEKLLPALLFEIKEKNRIILLMGDSGSGKTTIFNLLTRELSNKEFTAVGIPPGTYSGVKLLHMVLKVLKNVSYLPADFTALTYMFINFINKNEKTERKKIIIYFDNIDKITELQDFKQIFWKMVKIASKDSSTLKLILSGETNIRKKLEKSFTLTPPIVQYYINPLDEKETIKYLNYMIEIAGGETEKIFKPETLKMIFEYSKGLPGKINEICNLCLTLAETYKVTSIDRKIIEEAIRKIKEIKFKKTYQPSSIIKTLFKEDISDLVEHDLTKNLYKEVLEFSKKLFRLKKEKIFLLDVDYLRNLIERILEHIESKDTRLSELVSEDIKEKEYLPRHSLNVCILSMILGNALGFEKNKLIQLGISSFLHDIGMIDISEIIYKEEKLKDNEIENVKLHPIKGKEILEKLNNYYTDRGIIPDAASTHHERIDGSGYPNGINGKENIHEFGKIIGLIDVYEALTHSRPYRQRLSKESAIATIVEMDGHKFDEPLINHLMFELGYFLPEMTVKLNTGEICKVLRTNDGQPSRPVLTVIYEKDGTKANKRTVDLSSSPDLYIEEIVEEKI